MTYIHVQLIFVSAEWMYGVVQHQGIKLPGMLVHQHDVSRQSLGIESVHVPGDAAAADAAGDAPCQETSVVTQVVRLFAESADLQHIVTK